MSSKKMKEISESFDNVEWDGKGLKAQCPVCGIGTLYIREDSSAGRIRLRSSCDCKRKDVLGVSALDEEDLRLERNAGPRFASKLPDIYIVPNDKIANSHQCMFHRCAFQHT